VSEKAPDSLIFIASSTIITILSLSVTIAIFYCYKLKLKRIKKEYEDATKEWTTAGPEKAVGDILHYFHGFVRAKGLDILRVLGLNPGIPRQHLTRTLPQKVNKNFLPEFA